jgi:hypothetical protein
MAGESEALERSAETIKKASDRSLGKLNRSCNKVRPFSIVTRPNTGRTGGKAMARTTVVPSLKRSWERLS